MNHRQTGGQIDGLSPLPVVEGVKRLTTDFYCLVQYAAAQDYFYDCVIINGDESWCIAIQMRQIESTANCRWSGEEENESQTDRLVDRQTD